MESPEVRKETMLFKFMQMDLLRKETMLFKFMQMDLFRDP